MMTYTDSSWFHAFKYIVILFSSWLFIVRFSTMNLLVFFLVEGDGLRVKQSCTLTSDTVCVPLLGYYCIDLLCNCKRAMKHSSCSPGQYINQTGTEFRDTVCDYCPAGSYSDGTFCKLHTK
uniref:TNFR-Cys domain-containing protein n=1 Tax=Cyprinus carpio TaxID=7962 RepID=A0A8C1LTU2_CYPCA